MLYESPSYTQAIWKVAEPTSGVVTVSTTVVAGVVTDGINITSFQLVPSLVV